MSSHPGAKGLGQGEGVQAIHVLVDLENNQPTLEDVQRLVPGVTHAWLFHSRSQVKRLASFAPLGAEQTPVPISRPGKNALDFHLAFYVGYIAARNPGARIVIVAIDRGYRPMIEHAVTMGFDVTQVPFKPRAAPVKKAVGKKAVARKKPAGQVQAKKAPVAKTAAKQAPAKNPPAKKAVAEKAAPKKAAPKKVLPASQPVARDAKAPVPAPVAARKAVPAKQALPTKPAAKAPPGKPAPRKATVKAAPPTAPVAPPGRGARRTKALAPAARATAMAPVAPVVPEAPNTRGKPPAAEKIIANLRKMGEKRPKKLKQLRRYLSSMLGTGEADPAVGRLLDHLLAAGVVRMSGDALVYP